MSKETLIDGLEECISLLKSPEWRHYVAFLEGRKETLQERVNTAVRAKDDEGARIALALMDDSDKQIKLFRQSVADAEQKIRSKR